MTSFKRLSTKLQPKATVTGVSKSRVLMAKSRSDNILSDLSNQSDSSSSCSADIEPNRPKSSGRMFVAARNLLKLFSASKSTSSVDAVAKLHLYANNNNNNNTTVRIPLSTPVASKPKSKFETVRVQMLLSYQALGFTLAGYCPCHVAKLEANSIAALVGLQVGDLIIKINDKNVSRAKCESIIKIIKSMNGEQMLTLDVMRPGKKPETVINSTENNANQPNANKHRPHTQHHTSHKKPPPNRKTNNNNTTTTRKKPTRKQTTTTTTTTTHTHMPSPIPYLPPTTNTRQPSHKHSVTDSDYRSQSYQSECERSLLEQAQKDRDFCHMNACEHILNLEEKFIDSMQRGVQQYSRPLRHCMMISPRQHHALFQNIEKILAISEYQLNQLISHDDSALFDMFNTIGKLYANKLRMSAEAFDIYLNGIEHSFQLLANLTKASGNACGGSLGKFLVESGDDINMDLRTFLLLPLYYVVGVHRGLQLIRSKTSEVNSDYQALCGLLGTLRAHVERAVDMLERLGGEAVDPLGKCVGGEDSCVAGELVYAGDLQVCGANGWVEVRARLFTDRVCVGGSEILLTSIVGFDFSSVGRSEFQFSYLASDSGTRQVCLRADSLHEKLKWKCLLRN